jgi:hypothetical protein
MSLTATRTACLLALLLFTARCFSQDSLAPDVTTVTRITFLMPGVSHEARLARSQSLYVHPHLAVEAGIGWSSYFGFQAAAVADPALAVGYRYYYNMAKRMAKGKSTERNSANYVAALYDVTLTKGRLSDEHILEDRRRPVHVLGAVWGLQRNRGKRFCLDLNLGACYTFAKGTEWNNAEQKYTPVTIAKPAPYANLSLGFWLGKRE